MQGATASNATERTAVWRDIEQHDSAEISTSPRGVAIDEHARRRMELERWKREDNHRRVHRR